MRDDERRIDLAALDALEQRTHVALHVRLAALDRDRLVDDGAERQLVDEAAVHAGNGHRAALAARLDRLAQHAGPIGRQAHRLLRAIVGADEAMHVRFHADGVDAGVRSAAAGHLLAAPPRRRSIRSRAFRRRSTRALRRRSGKRSMAITRSAPSSIALCDREQADRPAAPHRDRVARLDVAVLRGHVAGRQNVGEEQHLLVGQRRAAP